MDTLQIVAPLIGVVLGGALSGISSQFQARQERRRIIAIALADLLELRHRLIGVDLILERLKLEFKLGPEALPVFRNYFDNLVPIDTDLDERYNNAITLLSGIDPVLAFSLRSKNKLPHLLGVLRSSANANGADPATSEKFESTLLSSATPSFTTAVIGLAKAHSFITAFKVKAILRRSETLPPEVEEFIKKLVTIKPDGAQSVAPNA